MTIYLSRAKIWCKNRKKNQESHASNARQWYLNKRVSTHPIPSADTCRNHNAGPLPVTPRLLSATTGGLILIGNTVVLLLSYIRR